MKHLQRQWRMATKNLKYSMYNQPCDLEPPTLAPRSPAVCEKNVFLVICSSASGKQNAL